MSRTNPSSVYSTFAGRGGGGSAVSGGDDREQLVPAPRPPITFLQSTYVVVFGSKLNFLLILVPVALVSFYSGGPDWLTVICSILTLASLAERMSFLTEQLSLHTNDTIGGLLNVTFGNATELIVGITALNRGLKRLVQLSMLGSVLSNSLLVLGTAFFMGGLFYQDLRFNKTLMHVNSTLFMLATVGVAFPTIMITAHESSYLSEIGLSRASSLFLLLIYCGFVYFQLGTHKHVYDVKEPKQEKWGKLATSKKNDDEGTSIETSPSINSDRGGSSGGGGKKLPSDVETAPPTDGRNDDSDEEEEEEEDQVGFYNAILWLAISTVITALISDAISATIETGTEQLGISAVFTAAILLPIVGNATEHAGAVMFSTKGKTSLAISVAIGSSLQISLFVLPLMVVLAWMMNMDLDLNLGVFEAASLVLSAVTVTFAIKDGSANWLLGFALVTFYCIVAAGFIARSDEDLNT